LYRPRGFYKGSKELFPIPLDLDFQSSAFRWKRLSVNRSIDLNPEAFERALTSPYGIKTLIYLTLVQ
jgi:hypothetical protein